MQTRWTRWIVMTLVCAAPLAARAQTAAAPAAEQQEPDPPRPRVQVHGRDGHDMRLPQRAGHGGGGVGAEYSRGDVPAIDRPPPIDTPTAEEWDRSEAFLKEHAPNRWAILQNLDEEGQQRVRGFVFWRFRTLERLKNNDLEMYQLNLKRFAVEDEMFGIRFPIRQEGRFPTQEELSQLREKITALVDLSLEERELRVQRLREMLQREEEYLAAERKGRESAINERLSLVEQGRGMGLGRRRDGGGDGGGGGGGAPPPNDRQPPPAP